MTKSCFPGFMLAELNLNQICLDSLAPARRSVPMGSGSSGSWMVSPETRGKASKNCTDEKNNKLTSLSYMTIQEAQEKVDSLTEEAIKIITKYSNGQESPLSSLAKYLVERNK